MGIPTYPLIIMSSCMNKLGNAGGDRAGIRKLAMGRGFAGLLADIRLGCRFRGYDVRRFVRMMQGAWLDTAALVAVGVVCVALIARRLISVFTGSSKCGSCSKCGGAGSGDGEHRTR